MKLDCCVGKTGLEVIFNILLTQYLSACAMCSLWHCPHGPNVCGPTSPNPDYDDGACEMHEPEYTLRGC